VIGVSGGGGASPTGPIRTYLDSGVVIAAAHGQDPAFNAAFAILDDPRRIFIASDFVHIETVPVAHYNKRPEDEILFYEEYLRGASLIVPATSSLITRGLEIVAQFGVLGIDALHIAAAEFGGAHEFITTEKTTRPFFRVTTVRVISIHP
jgi:predicted nucleic acid-binding protein